MFTENHHQELESSVQNYFNEVLGDEEGTYNNEDDLNDDDGVDLVYSESHENNMDDDDEKDKEEPQQHLDNKDYHHDTTTTPSLDIPLHQSTTRTIPITTDSSSPYNDDDDDDDNHDGNHDESLSSLSKGFHNSLSQVQEEEEETRNGQEDEMIHIGVDRMSHPANIRENNHGHYNSSTTSPQPRTQQQSHFTTTTTTTNGPLSPFSPIVRKHHRARKQQHHHQQQLSNNTNTNSLEERSQTPELQEEESLQNQNGQDVLYSHLSLIPCRKVSVLVRVKPILEDSPHALSTTTIIKQQQSQPQICLFPLITDIPSTNATDGTDEDGMLKSPSSTTTSKSIPSSSPTRDIMDQASVEETNEMIIVNPSAFGKCIPAQITLETAKLVAQVAQIESEDWARKYKFDNVLWPKGGHHEGESLMLMAQAFANDAYQHHQGNVCFGYGGLGSGKTRNMYGSLVAEATTSTLSRKKRGRGGTTTTTTTTTAGVDSSHTSGSSSSSAPLTSTKKEVLEHYGILGLTLYNMLECQQEQQEQQKNTTSTVSCITLSLLEIVDEDELRDLLAPTTTTTNDTLRIRHPDHKGAVVYNLTQVPIDSIHDLENVIKQAFLSPSAIRSSQREGCRGHIFATIELLQSDSLGELSSCTVLNFVDLCSGDIPTSLPPSSRSPFSSSIHKSSSSGSSNNNNNNNSHAAEQRQARRLNLVRKSVSGLSGVLRGLLIQDVGKPLSYRDCTLTKLLQRSLEEPNVRVVLIATVCPLSKNHERTLQTLNYVHRLLSRSGKTAESPYKKDQIGSSTYQKQQQEASLKKLSSVSNEVLKNIISDPRQRLAKLMTKQSPVRKQSPAPFSSSGLPMRKNLHILTTPTQTPPPTLSSDGVDYDDESSILDDEAYEPHDYMEVDPRILNKILAGPTPKSSTSRQQLQKQQQRVTSREVSAEEEKKDMASIQRNLWDRRGSMTGSSSNEGNDNVEEEKDDEMLEQHNQYGKPPVLPPSVERKNKPTNTAFPQQRRRQNDTSFSPSSFGRKTNSREKNNRVSPGKKKKKDRTTTSNPFNHVLHQEDNEEVSIPSLQASSTITTNFQEEGNQDNNDAEQQASDQRVDNKDYGEEHNEPVDYYNELSPTEYFKTMQDDENDLIDDDLVENESEQNNFNRDYSQDMEHKVHDRYNVEDSNAAQDDENYDVTENHDQHDIPMNFQNHHNIRAVSSQEAKFGPTKDTLANDSSFNGERVYSADTLPAGVGDGNEIEILEEAINEMRTKHSRLWESSSSSLERLRESYLMNQHQLHEAIEARQRAEEQVETIWNQHVEQQNEFGEALKECEDEIAELNLSINRTLEDKNAIERIAEDAIAVQDKLENDISLLKEEVSTLKVEIEQKAAEYQDAVSSNEDILERMRMIEEENTTLRTQKSDLDSTLLQLKEKVKSLEKDKILSGSTRDEDQKLLRELEVKQELLLKDAALHQDEAKQLKAKNRDLSSKLEQQKALETTIAEKDSKIKSAEEEVIALRKHLDDSLQQTREKEAALSLSRTTLKSDHSRLIAQVNALKRELEDKEIKIEAVEEEKQKALTEARKNSESEIEIEKLKADLHKLSQKKREDEDRIFDLQQQCETLEARVKANSSKKDHSDVSLKHALEENIAQQETNERLQQIITRTRNERDTNQETLKLLEEQIESETYARKKVEAENILLKTKLERSVGALEDLGEEIQSLKSSGVFTGTSNKDFLLRELEAEKQNSEMIRLRLESELRKARASRSSSTDKAMIKELQDENSMLRSIMAKGNNSPGSRISRMSTMGDTVPWEVYEAEKTRRMKAEEVTTAMALRAKDGIDVRNEEIINLKLRLSSILDEKESEISHLRNKLYEIEKYQAENHSTYSSHQKRHLHNDNSPF